MLSKLDVGSWQTELVIFSEHGKRTCWSIPYELVNFFLTSIQNERNAYVFMMARFPLNRKKRFEEIYGIAGL